MSSYYLGKPVTKGHLSCRDTLAWIQRCPSSQVLLYFHPILTCVFHASIMQFFHTYTSTHFLINWQPGVGILLLHVNLCLLVYIYPWMREMPVTIGICGAIWWMRNASSYFGNSTLYRIWEWPPDTSCAVLLSDTRKMSVVLFLHYIPGVELYLFLEMSLPEFGSQMSGFIFVFMLNWSIPGQVKTGSAEFFFLLAPMWRKIHV